MLLADEGDGRHDGINHGLGDGDFGFYVRSWNAKTVLIGPGFSAHIVFGVVPKNQCATNVVLRFKLFIQEQFFLNLVAGCALARGIAVLVRDAVLGGGAGGAGGPAVGAGG